MPPPFFFIMVIYNSSNFFSSKNEARTFDSLPLTQVLRNRYIKEYPTKSAAQFMYFFSEEKIREKSTVRNIVFLMQKSVFRALNTVVPSMFYYLYTHR